MLALKKARAQQQRWGTSQWRTKVAEVLLPFRRGISHGGSLSKKAQRGDSPKKAMTPTTSTQVAVDAPGVLSAAVGAVLGHNATAGIPPELEVPAAEAETSLKKETVAGGCASSRLHQRMSILPPMTLVGGGTFGKVYRMTAVPWSAVGGVVPEPVAVKVLNKLDDSRHVQAQMSKHLRREIELLTELADCPGIVQLLSWTEGLFDAHLVFPLFPEDLHTYMQRGALKLSGSGNFDKLPGICKQLLLGLSHMHNLRILHRDLKPLNMLVNDRASAVGDNDRRSRHVTAVIADVGGAIKVSTPVDGVIQEVVHEQGSEPTTYQYRAPELFVKKRIRRCSYSSDVWAMGVSIAELDLGVAPFGRSKMQRSHMDDIFKDILRILYGKDRQQFDDEGAHQARFIEKLSTLQLKRADALPWGKSRGIRFQTFLRVFFLPSPKARPSARALSEDQALSG
jgi:serine/threonine protein kinase